VTNAAYALLAPNAQYIASLIPSSTTSTIFLHGSGGTRIHPLSRSPQQVRQQLLRVTRTRPPSRSAAGTHGKKVGIWQAAPATSNGTLSTLADAHVWLGLKNSDDQGRITTSASKSRRTDRSSPLPKCCASVASRAPRQRQRSRDSVWGVLRDGFNGSSDVLTFKVSTRIGTNGSGASCGGHSSATGLRLYFDATTRNARFDAKF